MVAVNQLNNLLYNFRLLIVLLELLVVISLFAI